MNQCFRVNLVIVVATVVTIVLCVSQVRSMSSSYNDGHQYQDTSNAYDDNYNSNSYSGYNDASSGDYNDGHSDGYNGEERPKIKLNIGLHIPAMKITMPKKILPKITVRAKVRQPYKPSVMYMPEIQIDKTDNLPGPESSKQVPTVGGGQSGYNSNNDNNNNNYNSNNYESPKTGGDGHYEVTNNQPGDYDKSSENYYQEPIAHISSLSYKDRGFADPKYTTTNNYYSSPSSPQTTTTYRQPTNTLGMYQQQPQQRHYQQQEPFKQPYTNQYSAPVQQASRLSNNQYSNQQVGSYQQSAPVSYQSSYGNYQSASTNYRPSVVNNYQQGYNNFGQSQQQQFYGNRESNNYSGH